MQKIKEGILLGIGMAIAMLLMNLGAAILFKLLTPVLTHAQAF